MYIERGRTVGLVLAGALVLMLLVNACGGSGAKKTTSGGDEGAGGADIAAAEKVIAPYVGKPSAFPVTEKLKEVPKGAEIAYVDTGTPVGTLFWQGLQPAAKTMGVKVSRFVGGSSANQVQNAFDSVVAKKPDAVIVAATNIELWGSQAKELQEAGIPVVTTGITGTEPYGIEAPQAAENSSKIEGELMANYVTAEFGPDSNVAFYNTPELPFTATIEKAFDKELGSACPECSGRSVSIPVATFGNTAPSTVVSDLQANPDTDVAVFGTNEVAAGLPAALQVAGIEVKMLGQSPPPTALQYIQEGKQTAGLGFDLPVLTWSLLDQAAREITGQELTGPQSKGIPVLQFLTKEDIDFDPSKGWTGYPDYAERFVKLWGVGGPA